VEVRGRAARLQEVHDVRHTHSDPATDRLPTSGASTETTPALAGGVGLSFSGATLSEAVPCDNGAVARIRRVD
jgi:hypothetical protein